MIYTKRVVGVTLKPWNTFAIDALAHRIVTAHTEAELLLLWWQATQPVLLLGSGSNVLFLENYAGTVLLNRILGIAVREDAEAWYLHVGAGEKWHDLVAYTINKQQIPGLENLALIPGCVGSAPIHNIGAYGVELQDVCEYVDVLHFNHGDKRRLTSAECKFGYRDSIFKHHYRNNCAIVAVGIRLRKAWQPRLSYGDLKRIEAHSVTPRQIYDTVCNIRRRNIPDPALTGNAGSFFKNPVISAEEATRLLARYPNAPYYDQPDGRVKLAAGWLIECCKLNGYQLGGAAVHNQQALILINQDGHATGQEIAALAQYVRRKVASKFAIWLEPEVRLIAAQGEVVEEHYHELFQCAAEAN